MSKPKPDPGKIGSRLQRIAGRLNYLAMELRRAGLECEADGVLEAGLELDAIGQSAIDQK